MVEKIISGPNIGYDLSQSGVGGSRGAKKKLLNAAAWSGTWPAPGSNLDLDFVNDRGWVRGFGQGRVMDAVTFTRATSASYVDSTGTLKFVDRINSNGPATYVATAGSSIEPNLITYSEDFSSSSWTKNNVNITPNVINSPIGTLTASKLYENSSNNSHYTYFSISPTISIKGFTYSVYVKAAELNIVRLFYLDGSNARYGAVFDLTSNSVIYDSNVGTGQIQDAYIENIGNDGWKRISIVGSSGNGNSFLSFAIVLQRSFASVSFPTTYQGDGTSGIYIWGAQLEDNGDKTFNTPRFDWDKRAQLSRTNLIRSSNDLSLTSTWIRSGVSVTKNAIASPTGTLTGNLILQDSTTSYHALVASRITSLGQNLEYTVSLYVKKYTSDFITITESSIFGLGSGIYTEAGVVFSFISNSIVKTIQWGSFGVLHTLKDFSVEDVGNGWFRISYRVFGGTDSNNNIIDLAIFPHDITLANTNQYTTKSSIPAESVGITGENYASSTYGSSFAGDGTSGVYVWGVQVERGNLTNFIENGLQIPSNTPFGKTEIVNGILIEESRTNRLLWCRDATQGANRNLLRFSQTFQNAVWETTSGLTGSRIVPYSLGFNPQGAIVSADGKNLYESNISNGGLNYYTRNTTTGELSLLGTIAFNGSYGCIISPDDNHVYIINADNKIYIYTRNVSTGILTALSNISTSSNPQGIAISADGTSIYVVSTGTATVNIYSRNVSTGLLTDAGSISAGSNPTNVAISPDGTSVYVTNFNANSVSIYTRNTSTGALTANGTISTGTQPFKITVSPDGNNVYVTNSGSSTVSIYNRNSSTGALTAAGTIQTGSGPWGIIVTPDGTNVYVAGGSSNIVNIYSRNISTGALTSIGTAPVNGQCRGVALSPDSKNIYASSGNITIFNRVTGTAVVTDNSAVAPDSTMTAATLTASSADAVIRQRINSSTAEYTFSIYLYSVTVTGNVSISFDGNSFVDVSLTNSWTRFTISGSGVNAPTVAVKIQNFGDSVYIWGAQVDFSSSASAYESSTASAIWSKQGVSVVKNQTGIDGISNSATAITAVENNGRLVQLVPLISGSRTMTVYLKRISGTGIVKVTLDGITWSTIDISNSEWRRISLAGTVINPCAGILIETSGDSVAMDFSQVEDGLAATSPIFTTSAIATRSADIATINSSLTRNVVDVIKGTALVSIASAPSRLTNGTFLSFEGPLSPGATHLRLALGNTATNLLFWMHVQGSFFQVYPTVPAAGELTIVGSYRQGEYNVAVHQKSSNYNLSGGPFYFSQSIAELNVNLIRIGSLAGSTYSNMHISRIVYWPNYSNVNESSFISREI